MFRTSIKDGMFQGESVKMFRRKTKRKVPKRIRQSFQKVTTTKEKFMSMKSGRFN
jgi:hypothetical protein